MEASFRTNALPDEEAQRQMLEVFSLQNARLDELTGTIEELDLSRQAVLAQVEALAAELSATPRTPEASIDPSIVARVDELQQTIDALRGSLGQQSVLMDEFNARLSGLDEVRQTIDSLSSTVASLPQPDSSATDELQRQVAAHMSEMEGRMAEMKKEIEAQRAEVAQWADGGLRSRIVPALSASSVALRRRSHGAQADWQIPEEAVASFERGRMVLTPSVFAAETPERPAPPNTLFTPSQTRLVVDGKIFSPNDFKLQY
jgi:hypothetical protein